MKADPLTPKFLKNYKSELDNYHEMISYYQITTKNNLKTATTNSYKLTNTPNSTYLIITTNDIQSRAEKLDDFIRYKEAAGFNVQVITEDDFGSEQGQNRAVNIRSWLKEHYISDSIEYVLLIGDPDPDNPRKSDDSIGDIPMMLCFPRNNEST